MKGMDPIYSALEELIDDIYQLSHIPSTYYDPVTLKPVIVTNGFANHFCERLRAHPEIERRCEQCDRAALIAAGHSNQQHRYTCHAGLLECVYPIVYNDVPLGYFMYGQLRSPEDTPENREKRFRLYRDFNLDANAMERLYQNSPTLDDELTSVGHIMTSIAQHTFLSCMLGDRSAPLATRILLYISLNHRAPITTDTACEFFNISKSKLHHTIKQELNSTFITLLNKQRVESVCHFLQRSNQIAGAAAFSGFSSANYMTRVFRQTLGMTPSEYIALHQASGESAVL